MYERETREALGHDGTKAKIEEGRSGGSSGRDIQGDQDLDERISMEEIGLLQNKQVMEEMLNESRRTEVEEWERHSHCWEWGYSDRSSTTEGALVQAQDGAVTTLTVLS